MPAGATPGGLSVTFGLTGVHYAVRGVGRLWTAAAGAVLGAVGLLCPLVLALVLPF
ncbi:hypothetical protein [Streptomyces sp. NPDC006193]|uniref:hypothetical protein n=1 Tax=Streptomyces sp. NPDC006193 TaxID=3155717 RepID=UPI0033B01547